MEIIIGLFGTIGFFTGMHWIMKRTFEEFETWENGGEHDKDWIATTTDKGNKADSENA